MQTTTTLAGIALIAALLGMTFAFARAKEQIREIKKQLSGMQEIAEVRHARAIADGFYDNVLEADLTNDTLIGDNCKKLTAQLELPDGAAFSECIEVIVEKLVKKEYRSLYLQNFDRNNLLERHAKGEEKVTFEFEERADLVNYCWTRVTVCLYYSESSGTVRLVSYVKNIQDEKEREISLRQQANTDYLTGISNKRAAEQRISEVLIENQSGSVCNALLILDIDHFKRINDTIGHLGGDKVLRAVALMLRDWLGADDVLGRFGGDEFIILIQDCKDAETVEEKLSELIELTASQNMQEQLGISLTLSIGAALNPQHAEHFADLFAAADHALYYVKEHGRNGFCIYKGQPGQRSVLHSS